MEALTAGSAISNNPVKNYLKPFNDEIANAEEAKVIWDAGPEDTNGDGHGGLYFVDEQGNYYYQPRDHDQHDKEERSSQALSAWDGGCEAVGEFSYVLIVQEEICKVEQDCEPSDASQGATDDAYKFPETDNGDGFDSDAELDKCTTVKTLTKNKGVTVRHVCHFCDYSAPHRYLLQRHLKAHSDEKPFLCSVCERAFRTKATLVNHTNTHTGIKPHACKHCGAAFTTSGELIRHTRYRHTLEKPHACTECDYASVERSKLIRHIRCHTGERPFQCQHCTYASADSFKLKRHMRTHTGEKPYRCRLCGMHFTQSNSLKQHELIHNPTGRSLFACELCPTTCGRKTDLRLHVSKLHTADRPLKCARCGETFPDKYSYKLHRRTHFGEKSFKCDICPYASASSRHLGSHMLKHTHEKPFACGLCDQSFRQKQLLRRHENLHHNPEYVPAAPREKRHCCRECDKRFANKGNLVRHMAVHELASGSGQQPPRVLATVGQMQRSQGDYFYGNALMDDDSTTRDNTEQEELVVIEVVELPGEGGTVQKVTLLAPETFARDVTEYDEISIEKEYRKDTVSPDIKLEIDSCFGFDACK